MEEEIYWNTLQIVNMLQYYPLKAKYLNFYFKVRNRFPSNLPRTLLGNVMVTHVPEKLLGNIWETKLSIYVTICLFQIHTRVYL